MSSSHLLKIGVQLQTHAAPPSMYRRVVESALNLGVDSVFLWDHLVPFTGEEGDIAWDTWSLLGSLAESFVGRDQKLGVLVSPLSIREPAVLARSAATVARLGNGTFILGVGSGGFVHDDNLTDAPKELRERMILFSRRFKFLRDEVSRINASCETEILLWVGGSGDKITIPLAVELADGWSGFGPASEFINKANRFVGTDHELSVLLTPKDQNNDLQAYFDAGARHVIRSLRPNNHLGFNLEPISQMLSERALLIGSL